MDEWIGSTSVGYLLAAFGKVITKTSGKNWLFISRIEREIESRSWGSCYVRRCQIVKEDTSEDIQEEHLIKLLS